MRRSRRRAEQPPALGAAAANRDAVQAERPAGVLNIVPGGRQTGADLVAHRDVDKVAFTGSTNAGREIGAVCGGLLRPVTLELGGKSAAILTDNGAVIWRLPLHAFAHKVSAPTVPLDWLQFWDCFSYDITCTVFDRLQGREKRRSAL